jgi:hypothetical protein
MAELNQGVLKVNLGEISAILGQPWQNSAQLWPIEAIIG